MIIAIDFDGTIVEDRFPGIGKLKKDSKTMINRLYNEGHTIIVWTCRTGIKQSAAEKFLRQSNVKFHHINQSAPHHVEKYNGFDPRKIYADFYIDDRHIGFKVDWKKIYKKIQKANGTYIPCWKRLYYNFIEYLKK